MPKFKAAPEEISSPTAQSAAGLQSRKRPNQISIDLGEYKPLYLAWCERNGTNPSAAMRSIVARLHANASPPGSKAAEAGGPRAAVVEEGAEKPTRKAQVTLTDSEWLRVDGLAKAQGFAVGRHGVNRWLVALVRSKLTGMPQFGHPELEALARSNTALLAIGRNLNQIARALNTDARNRDAYRVDLLEELEVLVKQHTRHVATVMRANSERWELA